MRIGPVILLLLTLPLLADATVIGASPGELTFKNTTRSGEYVGYLTLSTTDKQIYCTIAATGDTETWFTTEKQTFELNQHNPLKVPIRLTVPDTTPNGIYNGLLEVKSTPAPDRSSATGMSVGAAVYVKTTIEVTGAEGVPFRVLRVTVTNAKEGEPIKTDVGVRNNLARAVKPEIELKIMSSDMKQTFSATTVSKETVDPISKKTITTYVPSTGIPAGIYLMEFKISTDEGELWSSQEIFYIVSPEKPTPNLRLEGTLENAILSSANLSLGETLNINGRFKNTGDAPLDAKIRVNIIKGGKIIATNESTNEIVNLGEEKDLQTTYTPPQAGEYTLQIWAEYSGGQKTQPRQSTIKVFTYSKPLLNLDINFYLIAGPAIILIIIWLLLYYKKYYQREE